MMRPLLPLLAMLSCLCGATTSANAESDARVKVLKASPPSQKAALWKALYRRHDRLLRCFNSASARSVNPSRSVRLMVMRNKGKVTASPRSRIRGDARYVACLQRVTVASVKGLKRLRLGEISYYFPVDPRRADAPPHALSGP